MFNRRTLLQPALRRASIASALTLAALTGVAHAASAPLALGRQAASTPVTGTVWLQLHNKAALDSAVKAMYTPGSASFHKFGAVSDLAKFAPTAAEVAKVKAELTANHLTIVSVDKNNFSIKVSGQSSNFESAFHTTISQYKLKSGLIINGFDAKPSMRNGASSLFKALTGVGGHNKIEASAKFPIDPGTGKQAGLRSASAIKPAASSSPAGAYWSSDCLYGQATDTFGTGATTATYSGFTYGASIANTTQGTISPCGYSPSDVYKLSGLQGAYNQGYQGQGQTIAIVDAYGSPYITSDLALFNQIEGTPSTSFTAIQTTPFSTYDADWAGETTLDVEWSHAIAPQASIVLIETPSNNDDDLQAGVLYVIENHLADIISNSYSGSEYADINFGGTQDLTSWDEICELAAYEGIAANFATGDYGDYVQKEGYQDVGVPADSPYATAVGGTSLVFSPTDETTPLQTGWGTNLTALVEAGVIDTPPVQDGFIFGAGGGISQAFELPSWQSSLSATGRAIPDVSAIADPYTGVEIIITLPQYGGGQYYETIGGTSLATPVFSGEWALLDQAYGSSLGQAAPLIAQFANTPAISDVLPAPTGLGVTGSVTANGSTTNYDAATLAGSEIGSDFFSAIYNSEAGYYYDLSFGTDSSLTVTQGWDNVTGWGTLNMTNIFDYVASIK